MEHRGTTLASCAQLPDRLVDVGALWAREKRLKSMYLYGEYGSGKTSFAFACILQAMRVRRNNQVYFWPRYFTARHLDSFLLNACRSESGDEWELSGLADADLLFIDDIDKVTPSDRFKSQLFEIVNRRVSNNKPMIITSNCKPTEIASIIDGAVISRMGDATRWQLIQFPKKDLRTLKPLTF